MDAIVVVCHLHFIGRVVFLDRPPHYPRWVERCSAPTRRGNRRKSAMALDWILAIRVLCVER